SKPGPDSAPLLTVPWRSVSSAACARSRRASKVLAVGAALSAVIGRMVDASRATGGSGADLLCEWEQAHPVAEDHVILRHAAPLFVVSTPETTPFGQRFIAVISRSHRIGSRSRGV